ncbi:MAG: DUF3145 domain-containing protein [Sporichthyaceae bacterium]
MSTTRGVLYVHSAQSAMCPHIEWAVTGILGVPVTFDWTPQPAAPNHWRTELSWQGERGTAAQIASALRPWNQLRYEVTEEPLAGHEGARYSCTPSLGMFHATIGVHGDMMISEERLRAAMLRCAETEDCDLADEMDLMLGQPWDDELEPFRYAGDGAPVRWLHQVG